MFTEITKEIGTVRIGSRILVTFPYTDMDIQSMKASCECSAPRDNKVTNIVTVEFVPNGVPAQLVQQGKTSYNFNKKVLVTYIVEGDLTPRTITVSFTGIATK